MNNAPPLFLVVLISFLLPTLTVFILLAWLVAQTQGQRQQKIRTDLGLTAPSATPLPPDWPTVPGRIMAYIEVNRAAQRRRGVRSLRLDAIYLVEGRSYTRPLLTPEELGALCAKYTPESLDKLFSTDAPITVAYCPSYPAQAQVDYASLPAEILQVLQDA